MTTRPGTLTLADVRGRRTDILAIADRHGAKNVRVYGSVARGEADDRSDVDLLVDFEPGRSLFDLVGLIDDLTILLGRKVDVVTEDELNPRSRPRILADARLL